MSRFPLLLMLLLPVLLAGQTAPEMQQVLNRLDRLEDENAKLIAEIRALRESLAGARIVSSASAAEAAVPQSAAAPSATQPVDERLSVQETRVNELSRTSVQATQRLPVSLSGMVLFNAYLNGSSNGGSQNPLIASLQKSDSGNGMSPRQSIVGFRYQGPTVLHGGRISASLDMDLWAGSANSLGHLIRMRTATFQIDWENRSFMVGQDKPLVAQRDPASLAQVAFSPLTAAGNLWLWQPQVRFEQRFRLSHTSGLRAQGSVYQTSEPGAGTVSETYGTFASARPALQGRFEFWNDFGETRRIEIAPGFHVSQSRVGTTISIPSRLFTADWMIRPAAAWQFTGAFFQGENAAGLGGLRQGFTDLSSGRFVPVGTAGGWAQVAWLPTSRLNFHIYGGQESNRPADLLPNQITRNLAYAGNVLYRLGPNVRVGLEASQVRTKYKSGEIRLVNHYDLALAYLF